MKKIVFVVSAFALLALGGFWIFVACDSGASQKLSYCYQVEEALLIITPEAGEIFGSAEPSFYDTVTVVDEFGEQETIGDIRDARFYYADGSYLSFSDEEVLGSGGLLEGLSGLAVSCP